MASISELLNTIKNAVYGREVRSAIHDAILLTYKDSTEAKQSDWEQNNESAVNYVENRPFWKETISSNGEILKETNISFNMEMSSVVGIGTGNIKEGGVYIVLWNGKSYECTAFVQNKSVMLGNSSLLGGSNDTGEPFCFEMITESSAFVMKSTNDVETITIKVDGKDNIIYHKLDPRYIEGMYYEEDGGNEVVNVVAIDTTLIGINEMMLMMTSAPLHPLKHGDVCTVTIGAESYITTCVEIEIEGTSAIALGDVYTMSEGEIGNAPTGDPFGFLVMNEGLEGIYGQFLLLTEDLQVYEGFELPITVTIEGYEEKVIHKIPSKFLDLAWTPAYSDWTKIAECEFEGTEYVKNGLVEYNDDFKNSSKRMKVIYNGKEYICKSSVGYYYMLNFGDSTLTKIPFYIQVFGANINITVAEEGTHTFEFYTEYPNKMPEQFMPESIEEIIFRRINAKDETVYYKLTINPSDGSVVTAQVTM